MFSVVALFFVIVICMFMSHYTLHFARPIVSKKEHRHVDVRFLWIQQAV